MKLISLIVCLPLVGCAAAAARTVTVGTYTCLSSANEHVETMRASVVAIVTGTSGEVLKIRQRAQLPVAPADSVSIVSDPTTCQAVGAAYYASAYYGQSPPGMDSLAVIRIGSSGFLASDPDERSGDYGLHIIFNAALQWMATLQS